MRRAFNAPGAIERARLYLTRQALLNTPFFGGVAGSGQGAVHIVLGQHDADLFDGEHGLLRASDGNAPRLGSGLNDLPKLFRGLRGDGLGFGSVVAMQMNGEIAEVRGDIRGIHYFGFAVASFTWLYAQATTPALSW
jgi:hypothetical protein